MVPLARRGITGDEEKECRFGGLPTMGRDCCSAAVPCRHDGHEVEGGGEEEAEVK